MPAGMPSAAQTLWKTLTAELDRLNLLTMVDTAALEAACRSVAQARAADKELDRVQAEIARAKGTAGLDVYRKMSAANQASKKAWNQYKAFCTEFGLTPASRSRLTSEPIATSSGGSKVDSIERVLCG
jgi:P27 family predicted phage terminase small subunit